MYLHDWFFVAIVIFYPMQLETFFLCLLVQSTVIFYLQMYFYDCLMLRINQAKSWYFVLKSINVLVVQSSNENQTTTESIFTDDFLLNHLKHKKITKRKWHQNRGGKIFFKLISYIELHATVCWKHSAALSICKHIQQTASQLLDSIQSTRCKVKIKPQTVWLAISFNLTS